MGFEVHEEESMDSAAALVRATCAGACVDPRGLVLHSDNGGPMRGSTMLATLQHLGIVASFSRPSVSDDNPYIESLFRTLKYRPEYPNKPFESVEQARAWVTGFVAWYNAEHRHSGIRFVTPRPATRRTREGRARQPRARLRPRATKEPITMRVAWSKTPLVRTTLPTTFCEGSRGENTCATTSCFTSGA